MEIKRMEFRNLLNVQNRDELRQWLLENYNKEPECWVVVKRGRPVDDETFWYIDAVEDVYKRQLPPDDPLPEQFHLHLAGFVPLPKEAVFFLSEAPQHNC